MKVFNREFEGKIHGMIIFVISILVFNAIAIKINKKLNKNEVVHIWALTVILEMLFDEFVEEKYHAYWYFSKGIDWTNIVAYFMLIPPVNITFLSLFPFKTTWFRRIGFMVVFIAFIIGYEFLTLLPEPWGYFHYGWWHWYYSLLLDPILLTILILYYKWICKIEKTT